MQSLFDSSGRRVSTKPAPAVIPATTIRKEYKMGQGLGRVAIKTEPRLPSSTPFAPKRLVTKSGTQELIQGGYNIGAELERGGNNIGAELEQGGNKISAELERGGNNIGAEVEYGGREEFGSDDEVDDCSSLANETLKDSDAQ